MFHNVVMERIKLTTEERKELQSLHKKGMKSKEADKIKAMLMLDDGYSKLEIARVLLIDDNTVRNWQRDFLDRESVENWLKDDYFGYQGKLNEEQLKQIEEFVDSSIIQAAHQRNLTKLE